MKAPYTFQEWIERKYKGQFEGDIAPKLLYDGYVFSLSKLGYKIYGNCYDGITVEREEDTKQSLLPLFVDAQVSISNIQTQA